MLKISALQKKLLRKWKGKPHTRGKGLQVSDEKTYIQNI